MWMRNSIFHKPRYPRHRILIPEHVPRRSALRIWLPRLLLATGLLLISAIASEISYANTSTAIEFSGNIEPGKAGSGQLLMARPEGGYQPALLRQTDIDIQVTGMVVQAQVSQQFSHRGSDWAEALYVFPLPDNAAVSRFQLQVGERVIRGRITEKQQARRQYQQAKQAGKKAALLEQQRANLFRQQIANIGPGESIRVTLHYHHTLDYSLGRFSLCLPTTLTPRYIPGQSQPQLTEQAHIATGMGWALPTRQVPDADRITPPMVTAQAAAQIITSERPPNPLHLNIILDTGLPLQSITSPYHQLAIEKRQQFHHITTASEWVPMDRDFVLQWQAVDQHTPSAAAFIEALPDAPNSSDANHDAATSSPDYHHALLMLLPPRSTSTATLPREVIFIIDTSGSMGGTSIVQARESLQLALTRLTPRDRFNIIEFNSRHRTLFNAPVNADPTQLQRARQFVGQLRAGGGTEMAPALQAALQQPIVGESAERSASPLRQVVFITDGSVGNESRLFELIHRQLGNSRLFTVGIGSAPNSFFMRKAAQFGRGTFTHIGSLNEVAPEMNRLFQKLENPLLSHLQLQWPDGVEVESWPQQLPDLYLGEPLLIKARLLTRANTPLTSTTDPQWVTVSGQLDGQPWQRKLNLPVPDRDGIERGDKGLAKLWAREKIDALLDEKVRGRDAGAVRTDVLSLALKHELLSPYTSFLAIEEKVSRPPSAPLQTQAVANLLPRGQTNNPSRTVAYPRTATSAPLNAMLGLVALIIWATLRRRAKAGAQNIRRKQA